MVNPLRFCGKQYGLNSNNFANLFIFQVSKAEIRNNRVNIVFEGLLNDTRMFLKAKINALFIKLISFQIYTIRQILTKIYFIQIHFLTAELGFNTSDHFATKAPLTTILVTHTFYYVDVLPNKYFRTKVWTQKLYIINFTRQAIFTVS